MGSDSGSNATPENLATPSLPDSSRLEECIIPNTKEELLIPAVSGEEEGDRSDTPINDNPLPKNDKQETPKPQNHSSPLPKIDRPLSQKFIDEALAINLMNVVFDNKSDNKIFKLDCSTNKCFMTTNYKFDKNSKLFI